MRPRFLWVALGAALMGSAAAAELPSEPTALSLLRQRYEALMLEAEGPPRGRWLASLEALERQKAAAGDYGAAAALRERRLGTPGTSGGAAEAERRPIVLRGAGAKLVGGVEFLDAKKEVGRFRRQGALMEWELPGQVPGWYEVRLVCGVMGAADENGAEGEAQAPSAAPSPSAAPAASGAGEARAGGVVEFREVTNLSEAGSVLRRALRSTGGWTKARALSLGTVELDRHFVKFSLRGAEVLPGGLMDFLRVELVPVARPGEVGGGADGGAKALGRLREVYLKEFAELGKAMNAKYLKELVDLEMAAGREQDNETLALVRQEKKRLERGGEESGGEHVLPVAEKLYLLLSGEARLNNQGDYLTHLRPAGSCEITWKLAGLGVASGTYAVEVECRMGAGQGGRAVLYATGATGAGMEPGEPLEIVVEGQKVAEAPKPVVVPGAAKRKADPPPPSVASRLSPGKIVIPKGSQYLSLRVESLAVADGSLFDLKSVRLSPVEPSPVSPKAP